MAITVTINGTDKAANVLVEGVVLDDRLGGRGVLRLTTVDYSASPSYRPGMLQTIVLADGATTLFGGLIQSVEETAVVEPARGIRTVVTAYDYGSYADRVRASKTYAATRGDKSIKYIVSDLRTTYLNQFGVTLDAGMATGPDITGEVKFEYATVTDCLNHVCTLTGWVWYINASKVLKCHAPNAVSTPVTLTSANSTVVSCGWTKDVGEYRNRQIVRYNGGTYTADDAGEQTTYGVVEHVVEANDITDATSAQTLADGLIRKYAQLPKVVTLETFETGFAAGQQGTVTVSQRSVSGSHLVVAVTKTYIPTGKSTRRWRTQLDAIEGDEASGSWIDAWRAMVGSGMTAASGGSVSGGIVIPAASGAFSAYLGGSRTIDVKYNGVVNVPEYVDVVLDESRFAGSVTVKCEVKTRDAGTSVQPRLYNVTDASVAGTGSVSTSTTWEAQSFAVTLASGSKTYRLQLVTSDADAAVFGVGSIYA